jgi:hypothetical protein
MKNCLRIFLIFLLCSFYLLLITNAGVADITPPWSTTFNCSDWNQSIGQPGCDGLSSGGSWICNSGNLGEQIIPEANNPAGQGSGQRHWLGNATDVPSVNNSGGTIVKFTNTQPEFWIRWYNKWQSGFKWNSQHVLKLIYIYTNAQTNVGSQVIPELKDGSYFEVAIQGGGASPQCSDCGWNALFPSGQSDGSWHAFEVHLKMDTNGSNGIAEVWIDGVKKVSQTDVNFGTQSGFQWILVGSNAQFPNNPTGCAFLDYDDIAISNTGHIGLLTDVGSYRKPSPPMNLR